ncbi:MAG: hypothetical protein Q7R52_02495 [archaeon]|nr:hypothetical protein [archaeon]
MIKKVYCVVDFEHRKIVGCFKKKSSAVWNLNLDSDVIAVNLKN